MRTLGNRTGMAAVAAATVFGAAPGLAKEVGEAIASEHEDQQVPPGAETIGEPPTPPVVQPAPTGLDDIVVTAQRRQQLLTDVPLSLQAFRGEELERTGFRELSDVINLIPGASEGRGNAAGIRSYQIRGVASFLGDSTIGYYLDEAAYVVLNRNYAPIGRTFDVERVEVLRGPQGTLYGLGSMGGTIRFITADPDLERARVRGAVGFSGTAGGQPNYYGDLALSVPLVRDALAVRGTASYERRGGYAQSPSFPGDWDLDTYQNYRAKILARPIDRLTIKATYQRTETTDHWGKNLLRADPPVHPSAPVPGRSNQFYSMYTGYVSFDAGTVLLESSTGYVDRGSTSTLPIRLGPGTFRLDVTADSPSFVQEIRAVSQHAGPFEWVIGGIYQNASNLEDVHVTGGPPISSYSIFDSKAFGIFGEASVGLFNNRLRPLVGLRYSQDQRDFTSQNRPPGPVLPPPFQASRTFKEINPRFNLSFEPNPNWLFYTNVARGSRSGTFNSAAAVGASGGVVGFAVDPDYIWSYEVGSKATLFGGQLAAEVALYRFDWSDIQLAYTVAGGVQVIRNAGEVRGEGIDISLNWRPVRGLTLQGSGNFNSTRFTQLLDPAVFAPTPHIRVGRQVASVPRTNLTAGATYTAPVATGASLLLNAMYTYISRQGDVGDPQGRFGDDHHLVRARAGIERGGVGLYLFGENLLNRSNPTIVSGSGEQRYYPRVIGIEAKFDL